MNDVEEGMFVTSTDGRRIGKVIRCDTDTFVVEKGTLFPKDYELRYEYVKDIKDEKIEYMLNEDLARAGATTKEGLATKAVGATEGAAAGAAGAAGGLASKVANLPGAVGRAAARMTDKASGAANTNASEADLSTREYGAAGLREADLSARDDTEEELRIPLMREEIDVETFQRDAGHVRIHKAVRTEEKHFSVPVRREELVIEHVAGTGRENALAAGEGAFEDQTMDITLREEDIRVGKHAVLREEVVVRKVSRSVEKDAAANLRTEDLEIEDTRLRTPTPRAGEYAATPPRH